MAWVILVFVSTMLRVSDFQAFATVCLAAVVTCNISLNCTEVKFGGGVLRRAMSGSGVIDVKGNRETI